MWGVGDADDVECVHRMGRIPLVHDGDDTLAHGDDIPMRHFELAPGVKVNHERGERAGQPVTKRIQLST